MQYIVEKREEKVDDMVLSHDNPRQPRQPGVVEGKAFGI